MASGFNINRVAIASFTRELQREFDRNGPIRVSVEADTRAVEDVVARLTPTAIYNGPVITINGDHAQLAWGNETVSQAQDRVESIAPGYEDLARVLASLLAGSTELGLSEADQQILRQEAESVLTEVVKDEPNRNVVQRSVTFIKGLLAAAAIGATAGVSDETAELVRTTIHALVASIQF